MLDVNRPTLEDTGFELTFRRLTRSGVQFGVFGIKQVYENLKIN